MNVVLDDVEEVDLKRNERTKLGKDQATRITQTHAHEHAQATPMTHARVSAHALHTCAHCTHIIGV